jgi:hypothetical protein
MYNGQWWTMAADPALSNTIDALERKLSLQGDGHHAFTLTPAWWQERLLEWATNDPDFRTKLLRFVDVLPALRTTRSVADHVRQYFRGAHPGLIRTASARRRADLSPCPLAGRPAVCSPWRAASSPAPRPRRRSRCARSPSTGWAHGRSPGRGNALDAGADAYLPAI